MELFENETKKIAVDKIQPNKINPNSMPDPTFDKLKHSITILGQMMPIIVRKIDKGYEIIDGEWRWRAFKALGLGDIEAKIIVAKDEDIGKLILASTIKGKHDLYQTDSIVEELAKTENTNTLKACNLDKGKLERKLKYHGSDKIKKVDKRIKRLKDEADSSNVRPISAFKKVIILADAPKYCKIEDGKVVLK